MSKRELINAILTYNRTAAPEFLAKFDEQDLKAYLDRVCVVRATITVPPQIRRPARGVNTKSRSPPLQRPRRRPTRELGG